MKRTATTLPALLLVCGIAQGQASFEWIGQGIAVTDMSEDGTVLVGNTVFDAEYETWRWVDGDPLGWTRLGRSTVSATGGGAGGPQVSYDGSKVSATILDSTGTLATQGIWADGVGWTELMPPMAADGIILGASYGSAWSLSGDGSTLGGFYWVDNSSSPFGSARPCVSTIAGGPVGLSAPMGSSGRLNGLSFDGSVGCGWTEDPFGTWMCTVWRDGTYTWIEPDLGAGLNGWTMARSVNDDGSVVVGQTYNFQAARRNAARWDWNGTEYVLTDLGVLPGTPQTNTGHVWASSVTSDGSMITGTNRFIDAGPFSNVTGFVWTTEDGMRDIVDVLADHGFSLPELYLVHELHVSPDGSAIAGVALNQNETNFLDWWTFLFRFPAPPPPECVGDIDNDGATTVFDFAIFSNFFGTSGHLPFTNGDLDGDGDVDVFDFGIFASDFGCTP